MIASTSVPVETTNSLSEGPHCATFPLAVALTGFVFTFCAFYPGIMSPDSLDQFQQALNFQFNDWHPPIMAILWSGLAHIWRGPQLMLLVQETLFWSAVYILLSALDIRAIWARLIVIMMLFSPALLNFSGVLWKDVQLTAAWLFPVAMVFAAQTRGKKLSRPIKAFLIVLVVYGALVRINAALVVGPLILYVLIGRSHLDKIWLTLSAYLGLAASCFALGLIIKTVFPVARSSVVDALYAFDLAALSTAKNENLFPFPLSEAELQSVKICYGDGSRADPIIWGTCDFVWKNVTSTRERDKRALVRAWRSALLQAPHLYVAQRLKHFLAFLAITRPPHENSIFMSVSSPNNFGFPEKFEGVYTLIAQYVEYFRGSVLFRPATWLALILLAQMSLLGPLCKTATGRMIGVSGLVSVGYLLTFLPFGVASDFRYCNLVIGMTSFTLLTMVATLDRGLRQRRSPTQKAIAKDHF